MERPLIGLTTDVTEDGKGTSFSLRSPYAQAVWNGGGRPVLLPPLREASAAHSLRGLQGLLLTGGDDLDPALFHGKERHAEEVPLHPLRESFDLELVKEAMGIGLPILAVCLGLQELCVAMGGRLHQFIPKDLPGALEHRSQEGEPTMHPLEIEASSRLAGLLGPDAVVNSAHRQAVSDPGRGLKAVARTADGVIEAVEGIGPAFLLGVQWHPELMRNDPGQEKLFKALAGEARRWDPCPP